MLFHPKVKWNALGSSITSRLMTKQTQFLGQSCQICVITDVHNMRFSQERSPDADRARRISRKGLRNFIKFWPLPSASLTRYIMINRNTACKPSVYLEVGVWGGVKHPRSALLLILWWIRTASLPASETLASSPPGGLHVNTPECVCVCVCVCACVCRECAAFLQRSCSWECLYGLVQISH